MHKEKDLFDSNEGQENVQDENTHLRNDQKIVPLSDVNYFRQSVYETLIEANTLGVNPRSIGMVFLVCLPLAGISSMIYFAPNVDAAQTVTDYTKVPEYITAPVLVISGVGTNFILNGYFSYNVPQNILDEIRSTPWPLIPKATLGMINYEPRSVGQILLSGISSLTELTIKAFVVALSTSQYVSLGSDDGFGYVALLAQLGAYGLMHWFAVTHFIDNWVEAIWQYARKPYLKLNQLAGLKEEVLIAQKNLISVYKGNLSNALLTVRKKWQENDRESLKEIYTLLGEFKDLLDEFKNIKKNSIQSNSLNDEREENDYYLVRNEQPSDRSMMLARLVDLSFQLQLLLLKQAEAQHSTEVRCLFPLHLVNAVLTTLCYIGFDLSVWYQLPEFCTKITNDEELCNNDIFITPARLITLFPLIYLAAVVVAPENTKKLFSLAIELRESRYIKPLALQRFPKSTLAISTGLIGLALFSWGTTITLNEEYIDNDILVVLANINSIVYNSYFNAFPTPFVAFSFALLGNVFLGKIKSLFSSADPILNETKNDAAIEKYLEILSKNANLLKTVNLLKEIRKIDDNDQISILFGGKSPSSLLGDWASQKSWTEAIDFLVDPKGLLLEKTQSILVKNEGGQKNTSFISGIVTLFSRKKKEEMDIYQDEDQNNDSNSSKKRSILSYCSIS